ncbi:Vitamin B12 import ATP-binding protein BtuD [Streptomyces violarus]
MRRLRGHDMAMIFQDPLSAITRTTRSATRSSRRTGSTTTSTEARPQRAVELLDGVGIPEPDKRVNSYPHEFSGGMRQRAMIAMALVDNPELLIADEPTTALDVTVQAQILDLIRDLQKEFGSAVIIITHDLGVVAEIADDILVMYGGRCVERGPVDTIFYEPQHPYTWGLLGSMPRSTVSRPTGSSRSRVSRPASSTSPRGARSTRAVRMRTSPRAGSPAPSGPSCARWAAGTSPPATCRRRTAPGSGTKRLRRSCERDRYPGRDDGRDRRR